MDKWQVQQKFWSSFGIPAYDENSVPEDAELPYITYHAVVGNLEQVVNLYGNVWYRSRTWRDISSKVDEIGEALSTYGFASYKIDGGYVWFVRGTPFAQRMQDEDPNIKRVYINVQAEFITKT